MKTSAVVLLLALTVPALALAAAEPILAGGDVIRPEKISGAAPVYPEEARRARIQGVVIVEATVDENGDLQGTRVLKGPPELQAAAVAAIRTWKFKPATREGVPVAARFTLTVNFQIGSPDESPLDRFELPRPTGWSAADAALVSGTLTELSQRQRSLEDVWAWAQDYRGPSREEVLDRVADTAMQRTYSWNIDDDAATRARWVETGLAATEQSLASHPDNGRAIVHRALLLQHKLALTSDADEKRQLAVEMGGLFRQARAMLPERTGAPE